MTIQEQLARLAALVDGWDAGAVSALERDLVLEKLRAIYENTLAIPTVAASASPAATKPITQPVIEAIYDDPTPVATPVSKPVPPPEPLFEPDPDPDEEAFEPEPEPESDAEPFDPTPSLFDMEPSAAPSAGRIDKRVILSLYGDSPEDQADAGFEAIGRNAGAVLGESFPEPARDVASAAAAAKTTDLRSSIGINDKFLIISEVFSGSAQAYERAVAELDEFTDLDEAMIHIHENYTWNPHNEGVKTLIEILTRKLS